MAGKIKKLLENELVGGTQSSDVYPVTSVKAVYDEENERLDNIINRRGVVNISTNYNSDHIAEVLTLEQAIAKVPSKDRVLGFQGKFQTSEGWKSYIFTGDSVSNWSDVSKWIELISSAVLAQELGDSTTKAISQGAVTKVFSEFEKGFIRTGIQLNNDITTNVDDYEVGALNIDGSISAAPSSYRTYTISNITDDSDFIFIQAYYDGDMFNTNYYVNLAIFDENNEMVFKSTLHGIQVIALPPNYSAKISQYSNFGISYSKSYISIIDNVNDLEKRTQLVENDFHYTNFSIGDEITEYDVVANKYINTKGDEIDFVNFSYIKLTDLTDIYAVSIKTITGQVAPIILWLDEFGSIISKVKSLANSISISTDSVKPKNAKTLISNVYGGLKNITIHKLIPKDESLVTELSNISNSSRKAFNGVGYLADVIQNNNFFGNTPIYRIDGKYYKNINGTIGEIGSFCIERYIIPKEATKLNVTKATIGTAYSLFRDCYGNILGGFDNIAEEIQIPQNSIFIDFSYIKRNGIDFAFDVEYNILEQYLLSLQNQIGYGNFYKTKVILENQYYSSPTGSITKLQNFRIQKIEIPFGAEKIDIKYLRSGSAYNLIRDVYGNIIDYKTGELSGTEWELSKKSYLLEICYSKNNKMEISFSPKSGIIEKVEKLESESNSIESWQGKKIVWYGTSIPAQGASNNTSYPHICGKLLGANVINESQGASMVRIGKNIAEPNNPLGDVYGIRGCSYTNVLYALSYTQKEKYDIMQNWTTEQRKANLKLQGYDDAELVDVVGYGELLGGDFVGDKTDDEQQTTPTAKPQDIMLNTYKNFRKSCLAMCWDNSDDIEDFGLIEGKIQKYLTWDNMPDLFVFDHIHNDSYNESDLSKFADIPEDIYNRNTAVGAMNYVLKKIFDFNPRANVMICGTYNNTTNQWYMVTKAQEVVADIWGIPLYKLWNFTAMQREQYVSVETNGYWDSNGVWQREGYNGSNDSVSNNSPRQLEDGTWVHTISMLNSKMKDNLHPATKEVRTYMAKLIALYIKNNIALL
jgi:hypothetical protein